MKTKNIFKALAMAMLMPAMLLTTACSNEDDVANNPANTQVVAKKGYTLPVTVDVTRGGDATTRATYNESTRKLEFSTGDKLFVQGSDYPLNSVGQFAGTLTWVSDGTFSGTITTQHEWTKTAAELFEHAISSGGSVSATLLPAGYESYDYLEIMDDGYEALLGESANNSFATSKKLAVEQLSFETGSYTSGTGFTLNPRNAILNFTVTGFVPNTKVTASLSDGSPLFNIEGDVTTDGSGNATFAMGVEANTDLNDLSLTVAGNPVTLVNSSTELAAGKIYNITRAVAPAATDLSTINANYTASDGEILTGTLASNVKFSIADGATVTLDGVTINGVNDMNYEWAGITCLGDATIILSGTNTVNGFYQDYPGIQAAAGKTLIINGTGSLTASSYGKGAGIGGVNNVACGNIEIQGGTITATSGQYGAGIGGGDRADCGNITISGGTVNATGGERGAGIGGGRRGPNNGSCGNILISGGTVNATGGENAAGIGGGRGYNSGTLSSCGTITITSGVTKVTATMGDGAPYSIGAGRYGTCGTVTIGGVVGAITDSPYTYQP